MTTQPARDDSLLGLWKHRHLIRSLAWREILGRYRGSAGGMVWALVTPVLMLVVYTLVFSGIFQARWSQEASSPADYALQLFVGLLLHGLVAECLNRSPVLIVSNVSYVKRVVFPLATLPVVTLLSAVFHFLIGMAVLLAFQVYFHGALQWTLLWLPVVVIPYLVLLLGVSWVLAALGVYLRDIHQLTGLLTLILMFLSPVFYPASALPERFRGIFHINPLTLIIEQARDVTLNGRAPDLTALAMYLAVSLVVCALGYRMFSVMKRGFADVL